MNLRRLGQTNLWSYPRTPLRHHAVAARILTIGLGTGGLMFASMLEFLLSDPGWWRNIWLGVMLTPGALALAFLLPMAVAHAWIGEIIRTCRDRELSEIDTEDLENYVRHAAMKAVAYSLLTMFAANVVGRVPALRPYAMAAAGLLTLGCLLAALLKGRRVARVVESDRIIL